MTQFRLDEQKTSITVLMVVLALSSLGFAVLGLVLSPELGLDLGPGRQLELEIVRPEVPDLSHLGDFWIDMGYTVLDRQQVYSVQRSSVQPDQVLVQGQETLVLVPERHDIRLSRAVLQLSELFLDEGWMIQLEANEYGYTIGFWGHVAGSQARVLAYEWQIELLNPQNYDYYYGGLISVMGEPFDPKGFMKGTPEAPVLALIIDDWGYPTLAAEPLIAYPLPLTMAVLPRLDLSQKFSERLYAAGHEVILHQPMEPLNKYINIGAAGILSSMDEAEVEERIEKNIAHLPMIVGVNNHMGSKVTAESEVMEIVLKILKKHDLYFLDSSTTSMSVVNQVASEIGIPYAVNNQFIDNVNEVEMVKQELRKIIQRTLEFGSAIVIGHVRSATAAALWEMIPEFLAADIQIVPVSQLLIYPDEDIEAFNNVSEEGVF